ncbi:N-6 DNA methylase [Actinokineospora sp. HUAS TT18]|uniref:N-6 DNA methylase n=1 Tax=Actinokineospora sp. HUAS TT18 TaxID=3447451 RepID=UPI003F528CA9
MEIRPPKTPAEVKRHGKHYTPSELAAFLAERVLGQLRGQAEIRVLDPACGDGELLFAIHKLAAERFQQVTLVGYDLDPAAITVARARAESLEIAVDWHEGDFLQAGRELPAGSFDAIITNPPYVRTQQLGQAAQTLAADFGLKGRIDLTHPFIAMLPSLLGPDGVAGVLCSNRFLTTKAGANVRTVLQTALQPVELYDLGDTKLFDAAVLPAIVIALNRVPSMTAECSFTSAYEDAGPVDSEAGLYDALAADGDSVVNHNGRPIAVRVGKLNQSAAPADPWRLSHRAGDAWLRSIRAWRTFGDVAKIRVGIKTTADRVFIGIPPVESDLLLPLITHHNLTPWRISDHLATKVLYPYDLTQTKRTLVDMSRFPRAMAYLESHGERLKGRQYVTDGGREWYEIWVPQKPALWAAPKIVFPDISVNARFAIDETGAIVNGDCYWISLDDTGEDIAYLMLAVANSRLGLRFYDEVCGNKLYAGRRRWMSQYVAKLPIPDPETAASRELILATRKLLGAAREPDADELSLIDDLVEVALGGQP